LAKRGIVITFLKVGTPKEDIQGDVRWNSYRCPGGPYSHVKWSREIKNLRPLEGKSNDRGVCFEDFLTNKNLEF